MNLCKWQKCDCLARREKIIFEKSSNFSLHLFEVVVDRSDTHIFIFHSFTLVNLGFYEI
jgi:hypothetical protein